MDSTKTAKLQRSADFPPRPHDEPDDPEPHEGAAPPPNRRALVGDSDAPVLRADPWAEPQPVAGNIAVVIRGKNRPIGLILSG
jgi:hypothetical protein